jgi:ribosomal protein L7/L12
MTPTNDPEVRRALAAGNKIAAIKRWRALTGCGLKEAKDAIEAIPPAFGGMPGAGAAAPGGPGAIPPVHPTVLSLLAAGRTIEAIKVYREATGVGLAEAKAAVEQLARQGTAPGAAQAAGAGAWSTPVVERPRRGSAGLILGVIVVVIAAAIIGVITAGRS